MTGYESKRAAAHDKLEDDDALTIAYQSGFYDGKKAAAQPAQEPVLVVEKEPDYMSRGHFYTGTKPHIDSTKIWSLPIGTKLYTIPPQRPWVGLTNEERSGIEDYCEMIIGKAAFDAIEAKLKEKNT